MLHAWRRRADPPLLPVRTVRTSRTNNAELRAGTGGAPGRGSGGSRDPLDCRGPRRQEARLPGPTIAGARARPRRRARDGRRDRAAAGPPNAAEVRGRTATEATPGTRTARGTARATFAGATMPRGRTAITLLASTYYIVMCSYVLRNVPHAHRYKRAVLTPDLYTRLGSCQRVFASSR